MDDTGNARVPLRDLFEQWVEAHQQIHAHEMRAQDVARSVTDARLAALNELRAEVLSDRSQFARVEDVEKNQQDIASLQGKFTGILIAFSAFSAAGAVAAIIALVRGG